MINNWCEIYSYADNNSKYVNDKNINDIVSKTESVSRVMFNWFSENNFEANPDKSQFILFTNDVLCNAVNIDNIILHPFGWVKRLSVHIDCELNFNVYLTTICRKAGA